MVASRDWSRDHAAAEQMLTAIERVHGPTKIPARNRKRVATATETETNTQHTFIETHTSPTSPNVMLSPVVTNAESRWSHGNRRHAGNASLVPDVRSGTCLHTCWSYRATVEVERYHELHDSTPFSRLEPLAKDLGRLTVPLSHSSHALVTRR